MGSGLREAGAGAGRREPRAGGVIEESGRGSAGMASAYDRDQRG
jgi:hypothetical protein